MPILATGNTFATGDSVTATTLNNAVNNATFAANAVDNVTTQLSGGAVIVRDGGITPSKLSTGAPTWNTSSQLFAGAIEDTPIGLNGPSDAGFTNLSVSDTTRVYEMIERASISGTGLSGTVNFNALDGAVAYVTASATGNWTINLRGDGSNTLNAMMATGDSFTFVVLATQGATAYRQTGMQIDGNSVWPIKWAGGTAPAAGNASSIDAYSFVVIKTASATFTVLASQTKFA
jgi:hypothetical protein